MVRTCAWAFVWLLALTCSAAAGGQEATKAKAKSPPAEEPFGGNPTHRQAAQAIDDDPFGVGTPAQQVAAKHTPAPEQRVRPQSTNERVRKELEKPTRMDFVDAPLQDVVNYLKDVHQIEIQLDHPALQAAGVGSDTPMSRRLDSLTFKSALRLLLGEINLAYVVKDDVLLITTKQKADEMREVRVYDVTKLVAPEAKAETIAQTLTNLLSDVPQQSYPSGQLPPPIALLRVRIVPLDDLLMIRASQQEHEEISEMLAELSKAMRDGP